MKALIAVVALAGFGAVAGAIWMGVRTREPTVVADPYEEGLHYDQHRHPTATLTATPTPTATATGTATPAPTPAPTPCDLAAGPCSARIGEARVTLDVAPRPLRAMTELTFTVDVSRGALPGGDQAVDLALTMPGMYMGENRVLLAPLGGGRHRGRGVVVRCPSGHRTWAAEVSVRPREPATAAPVRAVFTFDVAD